MAVDLHCPNCEENLGKDTENPILVGCGQCGHIFDNPRGYPDEPDPEQKYYQGVVTNKESHAHEDALYDDNEW